VYKRQDGSGVDEIGTVVSVQSRVDVTVQPGDVIVRVDPRYFRPAEVASLLGDSSLARTELNWVTEISAQDMCAEMVAEDLNQAQRKRLLKTHGYPVSLAADS